MNSKAFGQNLMYFLDQIKVSGRNSEQRQILVAYGELCEQVEKICTGELIVVLDENYEKPGMQLNQDTEEENTVQ